MTTAFAVVKRHYQLIVAVGGVILIAMGVLIWTGELDPAQQRSPELGRKPRPRLLELRLNDRVSQFVPAIARTNLGTPQF